MKPTGEMEAPGNIMFVRHGKKPGEGTKPHGFNRHGNHDETSLSGQKREFHTAAPTAKRLKLENGGVIASFSKPFEDAPLLKAVRAALSPPDSHRTKVQ